MWPKQLVSCFFTKCLKISFGFIINKIKSSRFVVNDYSECRGMPMRSLFGTDPAFGSVAYERALCLSPGIALSWGELTWPSSHKLVGAEGQARAHIHWLVYVGQLWRAIQAPELPMGPFLVIPVLQLNFSYLPNPMACMGIIPKSTVQYVACMYVLISESISWRTHIRQRKNLFRYALRGKINIYIAF